MRVLVTGASGRIGKALCDELLGRGDEVVGLTRDPDKARRGAAAGDLARLGADARTPAAAAFEGVDGVINLVGEKINQRWSDDAKRKTWTRAKSPPTTWSGRSRGWRRSRRCW